MPPAGPGSSGAPAFGGILTLDAARRIDVRVLAGLRPEPVLEGDPVARGAYRFVRHPIYLGWVLLVWRRPT
jgi:protein-S-isoprenylcysteine O-methyltransferase Ste14